MCPSLARRANVSGENFSQTHIALVGWRQLPYSCCSSSTSTSKVGLKVPPISPSYLPYMDLLRFIWNFWILLNGVCPIFHLLQLSVKHITNGDNFTWSNIIVKTSCMFQNVIFLFETWRCLGHKHKNEELSNGSPKEFLGNEKVYKVLRSPYNKARALGIITTSESSIKSFIYSFLSFLSQFKCFLYFSFC